ncbi:MAG: HDOD domain-containing protein [Desulfobacterota bacterium]|nr:HDOD domain-containing protein [Thermodesulfobacteriota bacterium]
MTPAEILKRIERLGPLGTLPTVAEKINQAVAQESCTPALLAAIIEKDAALATRVLKLANSSFYGLSRRVDTIPRAITVLGFNLVRDTALTVSVYRLFAGKSSDGCDIEGLWLHSLACAVAARCLAARFDAGAAQHAFLGGVLHDIGILLLSRVFPEEMHTVCGSKCTTEDLLTVERNTIGTTHPELGALAAECWHFPAALVELIRCHHRPLAARHLPCSVAAVHAGNEIVKAMNLGKALSFYVGKIDPPVWQMLNIHAADLPSLIRTIAKDFETARELFTG